MQRRRVGVFERRSAGGQKPRQIGQVVAVGGEREARRAAFGRQHLEKRFEPPRHRALGRARRRLFREARIGQHLLDRNRRHGEIPMGEEQAAAEDRQHQDDNEEMVSLPMLRPAFPLSRPFGRLPAC